jgi:WD40 repeat protein
LAVALSPGTRLGPYEVVELLGAGGMGEVYRALDPRLGREVAVKVLPEEVGRDVERLARFEREARAVAALNHPSILTVHDVGTHEGTPYVVMELLEGETLRELVSRRAPTQRQVLSLAVQAARGLEAAHAKGILHRDLKPENLFLTTDGRLKILDFGLAKVVSAGTAGSQEATASSPSRPGQLLGTVGYMSPELVRGLPLDGRTDLFSLGVVLYELLGARHPFRRETAVATLTAILEETPPELSAVSPALGGIVRRCLEKAPDDRIASAHDLAVALEAIQAEPRGAALPPGLEERGPYPGLHFFTEEDAGRFYGREGEIEVLWGRLRERRLLAVIGPSGAGKTSFVRAGVVATRPSGWAAAVTTPGTSPLLTLGQALAPELAGDPQALRQLVRFEDPEAAFDVVLRWRKAHAEALLVVDQLEELFTLNPKEAQARFAAFLGRLAKEGDVHVLLSLRDDFLMRCGEHEALVRVFTELTPLLPMGGDALRRALVEPAKREGYRFEDEALVEEMVDSVEGVRGALPLLAFAVARLWEKRDRERKLLTRQAYEEIGGVAGALAQHAEATMDGIGPERQGIVREIFRNLATAEGTRAVMECDELLSVFPEKKDAEEVLRRLVEERLLTTYEVEGAEGEPSHHRVEVVHESLLKAWPRLVRWQAQDEEGAVLRDQLKQAAHLWEEKGRSPDVLWSGTAFREFELWRERYPGNLTALEEGFARSMTERTQRRKRLRRLVAGSVVAVALAVAAVTGLLWRRSEAARDQAREEARRAEASKLLALGRAELDRYPTAAVAYAGKSLEVADTPEGRRFVVEALWRSPTARILPVEHGGTWGAALSPDDHWLAAFTFSENVLLWGDDGRLTQTIGGHLTPDSPPLVAFTPQGEALLSWSPGEPRIRMLSVPDGKEIRWLPANRPRAEPREPWWGGWDWALLPQGVQVFRGDPSSWDFTTGVELWPYDGGPARVVGSWRRATGSRSQDATGSRIVLRRGRRVLLRPAAGPATTPEREIGHVLDDPSPGGTLVATFRWSPRGDRVAVGEETGRLAVWPIDPRAPREPRVLRMTNPDSQLPPIFDSSGTRLLWVSEADRRASVWDLEGPSEAEPLVLLRPDAQTTKTGSFDHGGRWALTVNQNSLTFWALRQAHVRVLQGHRTAVHRLTFTPDGQWLVSCANDGLRVWPLTAGVGAARRLGTRGDWCYGVAVAPDRQHVLVGGPSGAYLAPFSGKPGRWLYRAKDDNAEGCAFDRASRLAAMAPGFSRPPDRKALRLWDLARGEVRVWPLVPPGEAGDGFDWGVYDLAFTPEGRLLVAGSGGVRWFSADTGASDWIWRLPKESFARISLSGDGRRLAALTWGKPVEGPRLVFVDLASGARQPIDSHGPTVSAIGLDATGRTLVTGDTEGVVRVGLAGGGEPHRLCCHGGVVSAVSVSPDGRWIASASGGQIRLWPMPDVTKPPLHTLPYDELMAKLHTLTNLRAVEDPASPTGYKLDIGPFPGWKDVPAW